MLAVLSSLPSSSSVASLSLCVLHVIWVVAAAAVASMEEGEGAAVESVRYMCRASQSFPCSQREGGEKGGGGGRERGYAQECSSHRSSLGCHR